MKLTCHAPLICLAVAGLLYGCGTNAKPTPVSNPRQPAAAGGLEDSDRSVADPVDRILQLSGEQVRTRLDAARAQNPQTRDVLRTREEKLVRKRLQIYRAESFGPKQHDERSTR